MARNARAEVPWGDVCGALRLMDRDALVNLIGAHWDNRETDLRAAIADGTSDAWATADGSSMLEHDWVDGKEELLMLNADKCTKVHFQNGWEASLEEIRSMLDEEGELNMEDEDGALDLGCPECCPPGSTCRVVVESKRSGELRLRVTLQTMCACMSFHGAPEPEEEEWIYSVLPAAPKPEANKEEGAKPAAKKKRKR